MLILNVDIEKKHFVSKKYKYLLDIYFWVLTNNYFYKTS